MNTNTNCNTATQIQIANAVTMESSNFKHHLQGSSGSCIDDTGPSTLGRALKVAIMLEEERISLQTEVEELKQQLSEHSKKAAFYDEVAENGHLFDIDEGAKLLKSGRTRTCSYLRDHKVLKGGIRKNMPYQKYIDAGLFEVKYHYYRNRNTGELQLKSMPFLTGKGMIWLQEFVSEHGRVGL